MSEEDFSLNGINFVVDRSAGPRRRPSDATAFTIVKTPGLISYYRNLAKTVKPRAILELGIFQGGSFALVDQLFQPEVISAVELSPTPVDALSNYIEARPGRRAHFGVNQGDKARLEQIVRDDLGGSVDLVIDDASHLYEPSRRSFEALFPLLSPGGRYIVEDWRWAHIPSRQDAGDPWADQPALTNLLFEITVLLGSTDLIADLVVWPDRFVVHKSPRAGKTPTALWGLIQNRGQALARI